MGEISPPGLLAFIVFGSVFLTCGAVSQYIFWIEIEPVLRRLGHRFDVFSVRKYKNGFFNTLKEYKHFQIAEKKPLTLWWVYWAANWIALLDWAGWIFLVFSPSQ